MSITLFLSNLSATTPPINDAKTKGINQEIDLIEIAIGLLVVVVNHQVKQKDTVVDPKMEINCPDQKNR